MLSIVLHHYNNIEWP